VWIKPSPEILSQDWPCHGDRASYDNVAQLKVVSEIDTEDSGHKRKRQQSCASKQPDPGGHDGRAHAAAVLRCDDAQKPAEGQMGPWVTPESLYRVR
jgi:hypothetical protein